MTRRRNLPNGEAVPPVSPDAASLVRALALAAAVSSDSDPAQYLKFDRDDAVEYFVTLLGFQRLRSTSPKAFATLISLFGRDPDAPLDPNFAKAVRRSGRELLKLIKTEIEPSLPPDIRANFRRTQRYRTTPLTPTDAPKSALCEEATSSSSMTTGGCPVVTPRAARILRGKESPNASGFPRNPSRKEGRMIGL